MAGRKRRKNRFQFLTKKFPVRMQRKLVLLFIAVILAFLVLVGRITYINVTKGSKYTKLVLNQKMTVRQFHINVEIFWIETVQR